MIKIIMIFLSVFLLSLGVMYETAVTSHHMSDENKSDTAADTSMTGNADRGEALFNDISLGNGSVDMSCNSCHPKGRGLEGAADKTSFNVMGKNRGSLEDTVNYCIEKALKGTPLSVQSQDMKDIVAYIKSLKK